MAQYVSLEHPNEANANNSFNSYDEPVQLASGTVSATITLTDGDGDKFTKSVDVSNSIKFQDDGPHAAGELEFVDEGGKVKVNLVLTSTCPARWITRACRALQPVLISPKRPRSI